MGIIVNLARLQHELARRGWTQSDLARAARLSNATVSAACAGRAVAPSTLLLIAQALTQTPPVAEIDRLISSPEREGDGLH
jgi:transcriptional regulator with XRE-family HTH domain